MSGKLILTLSVSFLLILIFDARAETVPIVSPDGAIQICKVTPKGVIVCL